MNFNVDNDPSPNWSAEVARRAQSVGTERFETYRTVTEEPYRDFVEKLREFEEHAAGHKQWFNQNNKRILAVFSSIQPSLSEYEQKLSQHRSQFSAAQRSRDSITANQLGDTRQGRENDRTVLIAAINRVNAELSRCSGLAGSLDNSLRKIETQLVAIEKRGGGLQPPKPVPLVEWPAKTEELVILTNDPEIKPHSKKR